MTVTPNFLELVIKLKDLEINPPPCPAQLQVEVDDIDTAAAAAAAQDKEIPKWLARVQQRLDFEQSCSPGGLNPAEASGRRLDDQLSKSVRMALSMQRSNSQAYKSPRQMLKQVQDLLGVSATG